MFRRGVISDEISQDLTSAVAMAKEFGLQGVEFRNVWGKRIDQLDADELARARAIVEEAGLEVLGVAPPFFKAKLDDDDEYREHLKILDRSIAAARVLGCNTIRTFTFWKDRPLEAVWSRILDRWQDPARMAEREGVTLAIENEHACFVGTGKQLGRFLRELNSPQVKALWDPGNAFCEDEIPFPDGYEAVRGQIAHLHVKDGVRIDEKPGHKWVALGDGEIDWMGQFRALIADGFDGYVSLETHYRKQKVSEEVLRLPSGATFSEGAAPATAECLENWNRMMREL